MTWHDLGDMRRGHWSQYIEYRYRIRFDNGEILWPWYRNDWPKDLWSRISKLRNINFMDSVMDINRWVFQGNRSFGVAMIQTFSDVRSLNVTWWPDMERPGSEIFKTCGEKMYEQMCQKSAENLRGCPNTPTSTRHGLKLLRFNWI